MKVCILSMQHVPNFGSLLQAYSLKKILNELGHDVHFIDIQLNEQENALMKECLVVFQTDAEGKTGILGKLRKIDKYAINRLRIKMQSRKQWHVFDDFRKNVLEISFEDNSINYDYCVIGSDEVFNCMAKTPWGFTSQLFGNVAQAKEVITYAASCGSTTYEMLPNTVADRIKESFTKVEGFSVRDNNTHNFVEKLTDNEIVDNLDPVLIYDFDKEIEGTYLPQVPEHYCVVYSYYNRFHSKEEIKAIKKFCKKNNLTPIAIGAPQFWIKDYVICSPFQCLKVFQNADFVITDTFHGTIFSAKYANRFAVITRESNYNKLSDLIQKLNIEKHQISSCVELEEKYKIEKDKKNIERIIEFETSKAITYLKKFIK